MLQTESINSPSSPKGNKHDDFFRSSFSKPYIVKKFLQHFIEAELNSPLDYDSLQLCDDTYITPELANYYSDRLWSIRFKDSEDDFQFLLLFEHKSFVPQRIHLQLLRYMVEDWTKQVETQLKALQELKKKGQKKREKIRLKLILPIILYHGQKKWRVPNFEELFGQLPASLKRFLPDFEFIVVDLSRYSDKEILEINAGLLVNTLLLFRHCFDHDYLIGNVETIMSGMENYDRHSDYWQLVHTILVYFIKLLKGNAMEKAAVLEKIPRKQTKDNFFSLYDYLIQEGEIKGVEKGIEKGIEKGATLRENRFVVKMWEEGLSVTEIVRLSELPILRIKEIIKNHIGLSVFQTIENDVTDKKALQQTATTLQISEQEINRIVELLNHQ